MLLKKGRLEILLREDGGGYYIKIYAFYVKAIG